VSLYPHHWQGDLCFYFAEVHDSKRSIGLPANDLDVSKHVAVFSLFTCKILSIYIYIYIWWAFVGLDNKKVYLVF